MFLVAGARRCFTAPAQASAGENVTGQNRKDCPM